MIIEGIYVDDREGPRRGQIEFDQDKILRVGPELGPADHSFGERQLIFPGFGDVHVHLREGQEYKEDYQTGAAAALQGGVCFCLDMPNNPIPPVDRPSYDAKMAKVGRPPLDIQLYAALGPGTRPFGAAHYKCFMAHSIGPLYFENLAAIETVLSLYRGCQVTFHAEDPEMILEHAPTHEASRPDQAEPVAIEEAIRLGQLFDLKVNIAHVSTAEGLELVLGAPGVTCEVTPHHLFFDVENRTQFATDKLLKMNPPLRAPRHREALMKAFLEDKIDFLATDHAPHTVEEKKSSNPSGVPHLDTYGAFCTWLLVEKKCDPRVLARATAVRPGEFFDGRPRRLQPEAPADLTVLSLDDPWTVRRDEIKSKCGWSPFEGFTFPGRVAATITAGRLHLPKVRKPA